MGHVVIRQPLAYLNSWVETPKGNSGQIAPTCELGQLFVSPDIEGEGVGLMLTRAALGWARERNLDVILVVLDVTPHAIKFYERLGFSEMGWFQGFDGGNTVMRYSHTPSGFEH